MLSRAISACVLVLLVGCASMGLSPTPPQATPTSPASSIPDLRFGEPAPALTTATVVRIVDGDTARMMFRGTEERVRFIGIDTPERGRPYFTEASDYAAKHLAGKEVLLELDIDERDRYGRLLAYVWLSEPTSRSEEEIRNKMFNAKAMLDGYAALATFPPNVRYVDYFTRFQTEARIAGRGLWAAPS